MRSKIKLNEQSGRSVAEVFDDFVFAQTADGLSEVTMEILQGWFFYRVTFFKSPFRFFYNNLPHTRYDRPFQVCGIALFYRGQVALVRALSGQDLVVEILLPVDIGDAVL